MKSIIVFHCMHFDAVWYRLNISKPNNIFKGSFCLGGGMGSEYLLHSFSMQTLHALVHTYAHRTFSDTKNCVLFRITKLILLGYHLWQFLLLFTLQLYAGCADGLYRTTFARPCVKKYNHTYCFLLELLNLPLSTVKSLSVMPAAYYNHRWLVEWKHALIQLLKTDSDITRENIVDIAITWPVLMLPVRECPPPHDW